MEDFDFLEKDACYFDSACQTLRPKPVINALNDYYLNYNSCGERVKYAWGKKVDEKVDETRESILGLLKLKSKHYFVSFTLNTTYGINLLLNQLDLPIEKVITSDIEHNSVFLPTITYSQKHNIERVILQREDDGTLPIKNYNFNKSLVVVNAMSNIDGRLLTNIKEIVKQVKKQGGFIIIDAAQAMGSNYELLQKIPADAIVSSAHKMYGASLGIMVINKDLMKYYKPSFIGGGTVSEVKNDSFSTLYGDHLHSVLEPGLQGWGEIIALNEAIKWLKKHKKQSKTLEYGKEIFDFLKEQKDVTVINNNASSVISFYHHNLDAHLIAEALSDEGIMVRSGYFCCHYYLKETKKLPHLVRISIGLHNTREDIDKLKEILERIFN